MKNFSKIELVLIIIIIIGIGLIIWPFASKKIKHAKRVKEIKTGQEKLVAGCDLTSIEGRIKCFSKQIEDGRNRNKNIKTNYKMIYKKDGKVATQILKGTDEGDVVSFERPKDLILASCASNTSIFDWTDKVFYISPEAINSGAICETNSHGRVAFVPSDLTEAQIIQFYQILRKPIE